jgi:hypothetical protein
MSVFQLPTALGAFKSSGNPSFNIIFIDEAIKHDVSISDLCDAHSREAYECGAVVFENFKYDDDSSPKIYKLFGGDLVFWQLNILSIERIEIDPAFRGRGIGLCAILKIMRRVRHPLSQERQFRI